MNAFRTHVSGYSPKGHRDKRDSATLRCTCKFDSFIRAWSTSVNEFEYSSGCSTTRPVRSRAANRPIRPVTCSVWPVVTDRVGRLAGGFRVLAGRMAGGYGSLLPKFLRCYWSTSAAYTFELRLAHLNYFFLPAWDVTGG